MPTIFDFIELREEIASLNWEKIRGHILFKDLISPQAALEKDADWVFSHTFATSLLKSLIGEIRAKLDGKTSVGSFIFEGGLGTGKSHLLTFLYHFFVESALARKWLTRNFLHNLAEESARQSDFFCLYPSLRVSPRNKNMPMRSRVV